MINSLQVFPKNKDSFLELIKFGENIFDICKELKLNPIIYGGLAYFYYTNDMKTPVGDLDILVPESSFPKIKKILKDRNISFKDIPQWKSIVCSQGNLKVDIDSLEWCLGEINKNTISVHIEGQKCKILNLESLIKVYEISVDKMPNTSEFELQRKLYSRKLENLQKIS